MRLLRNHIDPQLEQGDRELFFAFFYDFKCSSVPPLVQGDNLFFLIDKNLRTILMCVYKQ